jgi:hypothetical protein
MVRSRIEHPEGPVDRLRHCFRLDILSGFDAVLIVKKVAAVAVHVPSPD